MDSTAVTEASQLEEPDEYFRSCPKCGFENPKIIRFCWMCGNQLEPS